MAEEAYTLTWAVNHGSVGWGWHFHIPEVLSLP